MPSHMRAARIPPRRGPAQNTLNGQEVARGGFIKRGRVEMGRVLVAYIYLFACLFVYLFICFRLI